MRLCAAQWLARLFPPQHAASRYGLCLAAGDAKPEIRDAGLRGLALAPGGGGYGGGGGGAGGGGGLDGSGAAGGGVPAGATAAAALAWLYPSPRALLAFVASRHPALAAPADPNRSLPLEGRALEALVAYLGCCRVAAAARRYLHSNDDGVERMEADGADADADDTGDGANDAAFSLLLEHAACRAASRTLMVPALEASAALATPGGGFLPSAVAAAVAAASSAPGASADARRDAVQALRAAAYGPGDAAARAARVAAGEDAAAARLPYLRELLGHNDGAARLAAARLIGAAAASQLRRGATDGGAAGAGSGGGHAAELLEALLVAGCGPGGKDGPAGASAKLEEQEGSVLAAGFVAAQCRGALPPGVLAAAVARLAALLPQLERHPVLAGAAALALGYIACTGQLPDLPAAAAATPAAEANGSGAAAKAEAAALPQDASAVVLERVARMLPTTAPVGARETTAAANAALLRVATALGLGALGEGRREVLQAVAKGEAAICDHAGVWVTWLLFEQELGFDLSPGLTTPLTQPLTYKRPLQQRCSASPTALSLRSCCSSPARRWRSRLAASP